ncbi:hypothetical protein PT974_02030 [Cladobotryum mycophilum]|uniref:Uncharacterized protein n=1 Tax=Cladobotryum mycophilum TaxID=491253 RepID=A0ABR0SY56_9HYPO
MEVTESKRNPCISAEAILRQMLESLSPPPTGDALDEVDDEWLWEELRSCRHFAEYYMDKYLKAREEFEQKHGAVQPEYIQSIKDRIRDCAPSHEFWGILVLKDALICDLLSLISVLNMLAEKRHRANRKLLPYLVLSPVGLMGILWSSGTGYTSVKRACLGALGSFLIYGLHKKVQQLDIEQYARAASRIVREAETWNIDVYSRETLRKGFCFRSNHR